MTRSGLKDLVFLRMARELSKLGTCHRRQVGAIFVDSRHRILASGYNGPASGNPNCTDIQCAGACCKSGEGLDLCAAIHAEQNALIQCTKPDEIVTAYLTCSPCVHCVKMLANTGTTRIVFSERYPHPAAEAEWGKKPGRVWQHYPIY